MYENIFTKYDQSWENREVYSREASVEIGIDYPDAPDTEVTIYRSRSGNPFLMGISTGRMAVINSFVHLQIVGDFGQYGYGYVKMLEVDQSKGKVISKASSAMSEMIVNGVISHNRYILQNNLVCAAIIKKLDAQNISVPVELSSQLHVLQSNLEERNQRLLNSKYLTGVKTASPIGLDSAQNDLSEFMDDPKIGVVLPLYVIVIACVLVGALIAWLVYLIFKPDYDKSKLELTYSDNLKAQLLKYLPAETLNQLNKENAAFEEVANKKVSNAGGMGMLKTAGYAAAGLFGFMFLTNINSSLKK